MFEYCSATHTDASYQFFGTVDCGILDEDSQKVLMYSIVSMGGQWFQLQAIRPFDFAEFVAMNKFKGKNLREIFRVANVRPDTTVKIKCTRTTAARLLPLVRKDAASLVPEDLAALETMIAEVF